MQNRMKTHALSAEQTEALLSRAHNCCIATINADGTPYAVPVHFAHEGDTIYFHGLPAGQKIENINANPNVSLTVFEMDGYILDADGKPCDTNTKYQSAIIAGTARVLDDYGQKLAALMLIVKKLTPHLAGATLPQNMVNGTAVVAVTIKSITGKYYE